MIPGALTYSINISQFQGGAPHRESCGAGGPLIVSYASNWTRILYSRAELTFFTIMRVILDYIGTCESLCRFRT